MPPGMKIDDRFDLNQLFIGFYESKNPEQYGCLLQFKQYDKDPQDRLISYQESGLDRAGYIDLVRRAMWSDCSHVIMANGLAAASESSPQLELEGGVVPPTKQGLAMAHTGLGSLGAGFLLVGGSAFCHKAHVSPILFGCGLATIVLGIVLAAGITLVDQLSNPN